MQNPVAFSGKMIVFMIAACFAVALAVPSQVSAKSSNSTCAQNPIDNSVNLYFRQDKVKQAKKLAESRILAKKTAVAPLFAPKAQKPTMASTYDQLIAVIGKKPVVKKVAKAGIAPESPDRVINAVITAYTSTPDQTDSTPDIAASGKKVYDGMIAANGLPFGTKIKIPALYGEKIFTVDDRMNKRYGYGRMDIWLNTTKAEARKFGVQRVAVEIYLPRAKVIELAFNK